MKTIGLIGGMSWESSDVYYQQINRQIQQKLGGLHSAKIVLYSLDFQDIEHLQNTGNWEEAGKILADIANKLELIGAEGIALCTNTMHKVADTIESHSNIAFLHIVDATIEEIKKHKIERIGLLGTSFTMSESFYASRFIDSDLELIIPNQQQRNTVHQVIYNELCKGLISESSKEQFKIIVNDLIESGAQGIVLGCTEIGMLIGLECFEVPLFDTTHIHISKIIDFMLQK